MSLSWESPFRQKVVYSVDDGCSLWRKWIHHKQENTMLFSSILVLNGRPFLHCSMVWQQICWIDYRTRFEELMSENESIFALRKRWSVLNCTKNLLAFSTPSLIKCLVTKLRTNRNVYQVLLYVNSIEKWTGMKHTGSEEVGHSPNCIMGQHYNFML